jgi:large subunit ribosomal protein L21
VLQHLKVIKLSFSKERRKKDTKRNGHRQYLTQIVIEGISHQVQKSCSKAEKVAEAKAQKHQKEMI